MSLPLMSSYLDTQLVWNRTKQAVTGHLTQLMRGKAATALGLLLQLAGGHLLSFCSLTIVFPGTWCVTKHTGCCFGTREDAASVLVAAAVVGTLERGQDAFFSCC